MHNSPHRINLKLLLGAAVLVAAALTLIPFSSEKPDGLEYAAKTLHFSDTARESPLPQPKPTQGSWTNRLIGLFLVGAVSAWLLTHFRGRTTRRTNSPH